MYGLKHGVHTQGNILRDRRNEFLNKFFHTTNSIRSNNLSLKYPRFTPLGCNDIGIRKFEKVANSIQLSTFIQLIKN